MNNNAFAAARQEIIDRLDKLQEFAALGVHFTSSTPDADGWLPCRAWGRDDSDPSAQCNIRSGVYQDFGDGGKAISFFDFAVLTGRFADFNSAFAHYADQAGVSIPSIPARTTAPKANQSSFAATLETVARNKGTTVDGLTAYGATPSTRGLRFYTYNERVEKELSFYLSTRIDDKGKWQSKTPKGAWKKTDKKAGFFAPHPDGPYQPPQLPRPLEHWLIVEGVKDASAAYSILGRKLTIGLNGTHFRKEYAHLFAGVHVTIGLSRDKGGESSGRKIAALLHGTAGSVKIAQWPFEFTDKHGKDLRDTLKLRNGKSLTEQALSAAVDWQTVTSSIEEKLERQPFVDDPNWEPPIFAEEGQTDVANGRRLALRYGTEFRWIDAWRKFIVWDGRRWTTDDCCQVAAWAKELQRSMWHDLAGEAPEMSDEDEKRVSKFIRDTGRRERINAMIEMSRSERSIPIAAAQLDQHKHLLNCSNSTIDLQHHSPKPHDKADYLTQLAPVACDPQAACPTWKSFIARVLPDLPTAQYVQRAVGLSLTGDTSEDVLFVLWGDGRNGKSTFIETILAMLGSYACKAKSDVLLASEKDSHPTGLTDLFGKRFVACVETADGKRLNEALVKELTGGDTIKARRMREDYWEFKPTHKLWLATNYKPAIRGTDLGIWRRIKLIPFTVQISDAEDDPQLGDKLLDELPGILNWAIAGLLDYGERGLCEPSVVKAATADYRNASDVVKQFIQECCIEGGAVRSSVLYERFKEWQAIDKPMSQTRFSETMKANGYEKERTTAGMRFIGLDLAPEISVKLKGESGGSM